MYFWKKTLNVLPFASDEPHKFPYMDICSLGETFGVSRKLCQYTDPIEAVHSNLSPCLTYFGLMRNVRPKADVSSFSPRTLSTMGLCSINWPINCNEKLWLSMKSLVKQSNFMLTGVSLRPKFFFLLLEFEEEGPRLPCFSKYGSR